MISFHNDSINYQPNIFDNYFFLKNTKYVWPNVKCTSKLQYNESNLDHNQYTRITVLLAIVQNPEKISKPCGYLGIIEDQVEIVSMQIVLIIVNMLQSQLNSRQDPSPHPHFIRVPVIRQGEQSSDVNLRFNYYPVILVYPLASGDCGYKHIQMQYYDPYIRMHYNRYFSYYIFTILLNE